MTIVRRVLAVLIGLRGLGNVVKPRTGTGLVVLGRLLPPDTPLAPALGLVMVVYAVALWHGRPFALVLGVAYALFVTSNLVLFPLRTGLRAGIAPWMYGVYVAGALAIAWGAVAALVRTRARARAS